MLEHLISGGSLMVPIMLCSFISLAVVYDRWTAHRANRRIDTRSLRARVLAHLDRDDVRAAIAECEATGGPLAMVLLAGLRSYEQLRAKGERAETLRMVVGEVMDDYTAQAMSVVNKRVDLLTTVATAAPLLGMTGTVTGMITSFTGLAEAGGVSGGGVVAAGIAEALVTTAAGLIVALSAAVPQSLFNRWSDDLELEIEETSIELIEHILTRH